MKSRGLAFKLILFILSGTTTVFLAAFIYYHLCSKQLVMKYVEENAMNLARSTVHRIETVLKGVEKGPLNFASFLSTECYGRTEMLDIAEKLVSGNPEIYGSAIALEPYALGSDFYYFSPYCYRESNGGVIFTLLGSESYHYFTMDWYQLPKELKRSAWTEPYFDKGGGNVMMATFSVPFYRKAQGTTSFQGVVTADVALSWLQDIVSSIKLYNSGYAFLISQTGVFITHPDSSLTMSHTIFSIAEEKANKHLRFIGKEMIRGGEGLTALGGNVLSKNKSWLYYAPLASIGWSLGIVIPEDELFADVLSLGREVVLIGLSGLLLIIAIVWIIAHRITKPLKSLAATTVEIARGNLDAELPHIRTGDEIGRLTDSFDSMRVALKDYVRNLTETTAAKERIESELKIARSIQMSFLPKAFPPFPGKDDFEISARLEPARHIGGDLYDFFLLDDEHLFFAVGDVSDKGIPAALFMAVTKTLLKGIAELGMEPSEVLNRTNVELSRDNDSMMFVTIFCGVVNLKTGALKYSNAGHTPPLILRRGKEPEWLKIPNGFLLGVMEDATYQTMETELRPGDALIVYTDGVTEAMNHAQALYSEERLLETVKTCSSLSPGELTKEIMESVKRHASDFPQSDDITVLALTLGGRKTQES